MPRIDRLILETALAQPEGFAFTARTLGMPGPAEPVEAALGRLRHDRRIAEIGHGWHVPVVEGRFGPRLPPPSAVIGFIAAREGWIIARSGASAANRLGLSTQVPARLVSLTSGPARVFARIAAELVPAPAWLLTDPGGDAGDLIRAIDRLGRGLAPGALAALSRQAPDLRQKAALHAAALPDWMAQLLLDEPERKRPGA